MVEPQVALGTLTFVPLTFPPPEQKSSAVSCRAFQRRLRMEGLDEV